MKLSKGFSFVLLSTFFFIIVTARESRAVTTYGLIIPWGGDLLQPVVTITLNVDKAPPDPTQYVLGTLAPSFLLWPALETPNLFKLNLDDTRVINPSPGEVINFTTGTNSFSLPVDDFNRIGDFYRISQLSIAEQLVRAGPPYGSTLSLPPRQPGGGSPPVTPTINITTRTPERQVDMIARQRARAGTATPTSWLTVESSSFTAHFDVTGWTPDQIARLKERINPYLPWQLTEGTNVAQQPGGQQPSAGGAAGTGTAPAAQAPAGTGQSGNTREYGDALGMIFGFVSGNWHILREVEQSIRSPINPDPETTPPENAPVVPRDETYNQGEEVGRLENSQQRPGAGSATIVGTVPAGQPAGGGAQVPQAGAPQARTGQSGGPREYPNLLGALFLFVSGNWGPLIEQSSITLPEINRIPETTPPENAPVPGDETDNRDTIGQLMNPPSGQQPAGTENASFVALVNISESFNYVVPSDQTGLVNQAIQLRLPVVNLGEEKIILGVPSHIPGMMSTDLRELEKKLDEAVDRRLIIKEINFKNGMAVP